MGDINYCTTGRTSSAVADCTVLERPSLLYRTGLDEMVKIWLNTRLCMTCTHTRKSSHVRTDLHVMENVTATDVSTGHSHKSHLAVRFDKFSCAFVSASRWSNPIRLDLTLLRLLRDTWLARDGESRSGMKKWKRNRRGVGTKVANDEVSLCRWMASEASVPLVTC